MNKQVNAIVGIDMSKQKFDAALLRDDKFKHKDFPTRSPVMKQ